MLEVKNMNTEQIETRKAEILDLLDNGKDVDMKALNEEVDALELRNKEIKESVETRNKLVEDVIKNGNVISKKEDNKMEKREFGIESVEYRNAFLKKMTGQELTEIEERAYVHTTANTAAVLPAELQNKIYSNMEEQHPILRDVQILRSGVAISIVKHTAIVAGDAKVVAEGVANDDEQNTFVEVVLAGKKFSKHVDFSYELEAMALPAFQSYLVNELSDRLGSAMAKDIIDTIRTGLAADNKFAAALPGTLALEDVLKGLGLLKGASQTFVYTNGATFYTGIATLQGRDGLVGFIPNYAEQISGQLLGKAIKVEDALADGEVLVLDPKQFLYNIVRDITIESDKDIKKGVTTIAGHAIAGGSLTNDKAGVMLTVGSAA